MRAYSRRRVARSIQYRDNGDGGTDIDRSFPANTGCCVAGAEAVVQGIARAVTKIAVDLCDGC